MAGEVRYGAYSGLGAALLQPVQPGGQPQPFQAHWSVPGSGGT
jgi:hypothetical protein